MTNDINDTSEAVAVIGMAGRFPGAANVAEFWTNLREGRESISVFTDEELLAAGVAPEMLTDPYYVRSKGVIRDVDMFDASFFGFNPREAEILDPQHRLFLEEAWHALEDAGYDAAQTKSRIGIWAGCGTTNYLFRCYANPEVMAQTSGMAVLTSNDKDYLTTRTSYKLNLRGPSVNVQSACSTSLVAVSMATNSILNYECDVALAGGVSIRTPEINGFIYQDGGILSPDGHCRTFDERACGTVFSSGLGVVVLKRLSDAIADRDHIYAVIKGAAVNNDGQVKIGFTAPSVDGQAEVAAAALAMSGVDPADISYVEAHGTATQLGDPIEVGALSKVFRASTDKRGYCAIGSVKTNIGHTDIAAGVAGLIKTSLSMKHAMLVPSLHYTRPNPELNLDESPFYVNTALTPWQSVDGKPRRAAISSFGVGGTNAHVVMEEAPERAASGASRSFQIVTVSARTDTALDLLSASTGAFLSGMDASTLADAAFTGKLGRRAFDYRRYAVVADAGEAVEAMTGEFEGSQSFCIDKPGAPVTFMFSGQGSQYVGMGRGLYESEAVFRDEVDACCDRLTAALDLDLRTVLYPAAGEEEAAAEQLRQTSITQPALFVVEYALARLWMSWGVQAQAMIGHSVGEYVAACLSGVFTRDEALALIALRGRLMQSLPSGAMLAVMLPEARVQAMLGTGLSVAAINAPSVTVVAGDMDAVDAFEAGLRAQGIMSSRLVTSHAFHSAMMDPILGEFTAAVAATARGAPRIPFISNVTGTWITEAEATDPGYWARHLRGTVRFADGVAVLAADAGRLFLEVGPGRALQSAVRGIMPELVEQGLAGSLRHPNQPDDDARFILESLGELWIRGGSVDWARFYDGETRNRLSMPTYPFERESYFVEAAEASAPAAATKAGGKLKRRPDVADWFYTPTWKGTPTADQLADAGQVSPHGTWLLFDDALGLADAVEARLQRAGRDVVRVGPGTAFEHASPGRFTIDPTTREHYAAVFAELKRAGRSPTRVLHLANVTEVPDGIDLAGAPAAEEQAFYALLWLGQALGAQAEPTRLVIATSAMQDVAGEGVQAPFKALAIGPTKLIAKEVANVEARTVDLQVCSRSDVTPYLVEQLVAELEVATTDTVVAYRGRRRWVESMQPMRLEETAPRGSTASVILREHGAYLITGGLGGIGLAVALDLAKRFSARLVLLGRSAVPARAEWEGWIADHDPSDATSARLRGLMEVERAGGEVLTVAADVADPVGMQAAVAQARARFGRIEGVFHVAGVAGGGLIPLKTRDNAGRVLEPKVRGTLVLDQVLADDEPDFVVLFSSLTSALGGTGQIDYAAANAFLDAYAAWRQASGRTVMSIDWDMWSEVGMGVGFAERAGGGLQEQAGYDKVAHGLLSWSNTTQEGIRFTAEIDGDRHWALGEHLVVGKPTLVGTGYIDMAVSAAALAAEGRSVRLSNVFLLAPLTVEPTGRKTLELGFTGQGGSRSFTFRSRSAAYGEVTPWEEHVLGNVEFVDPGVPAPADIAALRARCGIAPYTAEAAHAARISNITFGRRWANLAEIGSANGEALALIELAEDFSGDLDSFTLHPAMLDVATSFAKRFTTPGFFLPISYKRLTVHGKLPRRIYSHARFAPDDGQGREIVSFDIALLDETGRELASIEGYSLKRVPDSFIEAASGAATATPAAAGQSTAREAALLEDGILTGEGLDVMHRILDRPLMPRVLVSRLDWSARIERAIAKTNGSIETVREDTKRAKPKHKRPKLKTAFVAPRNELEEQIAEIWQGLIGIDQIGVDDGFIELGGNSLLAVQVISRIRDGFQVDLPLEVLYRTPTIAGVTEGILVMLAEAAGDDVLDELIADIETEDLRKVA